MTRYSGEGMAKFYEDSNVRHLFEDVNRKITTLSPPTENKSFLVDDKKLSTPLAEYFISLRPCFLTLRCNDAYITEHYSPHRFSRQFGFCQSLPGNCVENCEQPSLEDLVCLWKASVALGTKANVILPPLRKVALVTDDYYKWWSAKKSYTFLSSTRVVLKRKIATDDVLGIVVADTSCQVTDVPRVEGPSSGPLEAPNQLHPGDEDLVQCDNEEEDDGECHWKRLKKRKRVVPLPDDFLADVQSASVLPTNLDDLLKDRSIREDGRALTPAPSIESMSQSSDTVEEVVSALVTHAPEIPALELPAHEVTVPPLEPLSISGSSLTLLTSIVDVPVPLPVPVVDISTSLPVTVVDTSVTLPAPAPCFASLFSSMHMKFELAAWQEICQLLVKTPFSELARDIESIYAEISLFRSVDISLPMNLVKAYFEKLTSYYTLKSSHSDVDLGAKTKELEESRQRLTDFSVLRSQHTDQLSKMQRDLEEVDRDLERLKHHRQELSSSIIEMASKQSELHATFSSVQAEVTDLESVIMKCHEDADRLKSLEAALETSRRELEGFTWSH